MNWRKWLPQIKKDGNDMIKCGDYWMHEQDVKDIIKWDDWMHEQDVQKRIDEPLYYIPANEEVSFDTPRSMDSISPEPVIQPIHGWIQTFTGKKFYPLNPKPEDICIRDIAHGLSNMCRFAGHVRDFYSVAQHCVFVSYLSGDHKLHGLLHDASEAYLLDFPKPLKRLPEFAEYRRIENMLQTMIFKKFDLHGEEPKGVKEADTKIFVTEVRDLRSPTHPDWTQPCDPYPFHITPLPPKEAELLFLNRFSELMMEHSRKEILEIYLRE